MAKIFGFRILYLAGVFTITLPRSALSAPPSPPGVSQRIYNGTEINPPHKYPFLAAMYFGGCNHKGQCTPAGGGIDCGASVLNKHWVVTAAHCCFLDVDRDTGTLHLENYFIITGLHNLTAPSPWSQNLSISHCVIHHLFNENDLINDVALIRVKGTIIFNDKVTPMNLPSLGFDVTEDSEIMAQAMGWGFTQDPGPKGIPAVPNEVTLPVVTLDTCQRRYGYYESQAEGEPANTSRPVLESNLCAGYGVPPKSECFGDSGSPFVTYNADAGTYTQVGIVSWGEACGVRGHYSVFSNVVKYISWLKSVKLIFHIFKNGATIALWSCSLRPNNYDL